jgi:hypothetical protein
LSSLQSTISILKTQVPLNETTELEATKVHVPDAIDLVMVVLFIGYLVSARAQSWH